MLLLLIGLTIGGCVLTTVTADTPLEMGRARAPFQEGSTVDRFRGGNNLLLL